MAVRIPAIILTLAIFLSALPMARALENMPSIEVYSPPSKSFPLKIFVEPYDYKINPSQLLAEEGEAFRCPYHDRIERAFYQVVRDVVKSMTRFADEHPEYRQLLQIYFVNASRLDDADIVLTIVEGINYSRAVLAKPYQLQIVCSQGGLDYPELHNIIMHEFLHTLGIGHVNRLWTDNQEPEVMLNIDSQIISYPTNLDLYAIYLMYFQDIRETNITLAKDLEYKMVVPYDVELKRLKQENERLKEDNKRLWEHLRNASDVITYLNEENQRLRQENEDLRVLSAALEEQLADLWGQLQTADIIISRLQEENEMLRANLSYCVSLGLELGEKCNQTIRRLVNEYNSLNANYSVCLDYLTMYQRNAQWFKMWTWIMAATALIFVLITYLVMKRHIRKLEEELDQLEGGSS